MIFNLLKIGRMSTVPKFVPEIIRGAQLNLHKLLKINLIDGAGRGNRTPMELPPTDFELNVRGAHCSGVRGPASYIQYFSTFQGGSLLQFGKMNLTVTTVS